MAEGAHFAEFAHAWNAIDHLEARAAARALARERRAERPRCGAKCRDGHPCAAPVVWLAGHDTPRKRCRMHGGLSTGPRTAAGLMRALRTLRPEASAGTSLALRRALTRHTWGMAACDRCSKHQLLNLDGIRARRDAGLALDLALVLCPPCVDAYQRARERAGEFFQARIEFRI